MHVSRNPSSRIRESCHTEPLHTPEAGEGYSPWNHSRLLHVVRSTAPGTSEEGGRPARRRKMFWQIATGTFCPGVNAICSHAAFQAGGNDVPPGSKIRRQSGVFDLFYKTAPCLCSKWPDFSCRHEERMPYRALLYCAGDLPVIFLKAALNDDLLLNPTSSARP